MNWLAFLIWLTTRTRTQRMAALAHAWLGCVLRDIARFPKGFANPARERAHRKACGQLILLSHILVAGFIHRRAREIAGLKPLPIIFDPDAAPRRLARRETLARRAAELLHRLARAEQHARKLAKQLAAAELEKTLGALSSASPAEAGAQSHLMLVRSTPSSSLNLGNSFERFARISSGAGPRPPPGMRLMGCKPNESLALAA